MTKSDIIKAIIENESRIRQLGVNRIGLFGSYARNEQNEESDIDILIDFDNEKKTFDNFMNLCFLLDDLFEGKKVEVVTPESLSPFFGPKILPTVEYVPLAA